MTIATIVYAALIVAACAAAMIFAYLAGYEHRARLPCGCRPVVLEPRADGWRPADAAEYGARIAMEELTFSEIEALGQLAERTFGHTRERNN